MRKLAFGVVILVFSSARLCAAEDPCAGFFRQFGKGPGSSVNTGPVRLLSDAELEHITSQRVCIKSFPWDPKAHDAFSSSTKEGWNSTLGASLRTSVHEAITKYEGSVAVLTLKGLSNTERKFLHVVAQGGAPYSEVQSYLGFEARRTWAYYLANASKVEQQVAVILADGGSAEQMRLYADYLYCATALNEGKAEEIIACVADARKRSNPWRPRVVESDRAEEFTYYSEQSLINMLSSVEYSALAGRKMADANASLDLICRFLDDLPALEPHFETTSDPTEAVLGTLSDEMIEGFNLDAPAWQRMQTLNKYPGLLGFFRDANGITLYLGKNGAHTLRYDGRDWEVLSADEAQNVFVQYCRARITSESNDNMKLFCTYPVSDGRVVQFSDGTTTKLTAQEDTALRSGTQLPSDHQISRALGDHKSHVLFSTPLMEKDGSPLRDADAFMFALQRAYPQAKLIRDPLSAQTPILTQKIAAFAVSKPSDLLVVVPDPKLDVPQAKTIANIAADLKAAKVQVSVISGHEKYTGKRDRAVFVITGHSSDQLAVFVRQLGDGGFLKNNYVIFNSCETDLTRELLAEINSRYGAIGTYTFEGKIMAASVQDYLLDLVHGLKGGKKHNLMELLSAMVQKQKLNGLFTVCKND